MEKNNKEKKQNKLELEIIELESKLTPAGQEAPHPCVPYNEGISVGAEC
ncbi:MAG: hypothetical protein KDD48_03275 [Bdellovibrionales bacterium]|nr:hypothetical protein [Bdellovibrionales bacterium]